MTCKNGVCEINFETTKQEINIIINYLHRCTMPINYIQVIEDALKKQAHNCGNCKNNYCNDTEEFCKCNFVKGVRAKSDYCSWWEDNND